MPRRPEPKGPRPPLPGLLRLTLNWGSHVIPSTFSGNSILHLRWSDNLNHPIADLNTLNGFLAVGPAGLSRLMNHLSSDVALQGWDLASLGGDGLDAPRNDVIQGSGGAGTLPPQCAVCVTWKAAFSWRGGHPRTYLPGIPSAQRATVAGAGLLPAFSQGVATDANAFIADLQAETIGGAHPLLGFVSYFTGYAFRPVPLFFPFSSAIVHDRIDSQRRRSGKERSFAIE